MNVSVQEQMSSALCYSTLLTTKEQLTLEFENNKLSKIYVFIDLLLLIDLNRHTGN